MRRPSSGRCRPVRREGHACPRAPRRASPSLRSDDIGLCSPSSGTLPAEVRRRRGEMERRARRLDRPAADRDRHDRLAVAEHRPAQHLLHVGHDRERQAQLETQREPFLGGAIEEARDEARLQRIGARQPLAAHDVVRIAAELGHAHQVAERLPLRRRDDGDADPALLAAIDAHRIGRREAVEAPALLRPRRPGLDRLVFGERDRRLVDAYLPGRLCPPSSAAIAGMKAASPPMIAD